MILLWVTVFLFVLLALAALVVDAGLAQLTRRQLQTAAEVAALEGARRPTSVSDAAHRDAVVKLVDQLFDDSLHVRSEPEASDDVEYGAGPVWEYAGGTPIPGTSYRAGPRIRLSTPRVYQPRLRTNASANEAPGDLVRGTFQPTATDHHESDDYTRADFTPDSPPDTNGTAFLARVRRTGETFPGDVGTAGPRLPYLFGRTPSGKSSDWYDARERGIAIRGTAIADLLPVLVVGPTYPRAMYQHLGTFPDDLDLEGLAPWAVQLEPWNLGEVRLDVTDLSLTSVIRMIGLTRLDGGIGAADTTLTVVAADGFPDSANVPFVARVGNELLTVTQVTAGNTWTVTRGTRGTQASAHAADSLVTRVERLVVGTLLDASGSIDWQSTPSGTQPPDGQGFVAVFASRPEFGERIVGFSRATWRTVSGELIMTPASDQTAARNANAMAHFSSRLPPGITSSNASALLAAQREIAQPLRAPIFVRAIE